jgi:hypothetical protein
MQYVRGPFPPKFRDAGRSLALALLILAAAPALAQQQSIFKWVDERGVVNYGNAEVPKNVAVSLVDTTPQASAKPDSRSAANAARPARLSDADVLREQLARSHEEIARLRQAAAAANGATTEDTPVKPVATLPKPASLEVAGASKAISNKAGGTISTMQ